MSVAPGRRSALWAGAMALVAICIPKVDLALSAPAPTVDADAELFRLLGWWSDLDAQREERELDLSRKRQLSEAMYSPRPDVLWDRFSDHQHCLGGANGRALRPSGRIGGYYCAGDITYLRTAGPLMQLASVGEDHEGPPPREINHKGEARRLEILSAHDDWQAERDAIDRASGYFSASAAMEAIDGEYFELERNIKRTLPRTVAGLIRKAKWVGERLASDDADDDLGAVFAAQVAAFDLSGQAGPALALVEAT